MIDWIKKHPGIILIVISVVVLTVLSMTTFTFKHVELANNLELINTRLDRVCDNIAHIEVELKAFRAELQADVRGFQNDVGDIKEDIKLREAFHQRHHADTIEIRQDMRRISDKVNESTRFNHPPPPPIYISPPAQQ